MASGMKWAGALAALCFACALWIATSDRDPFVRDYAQQRVWRLESELREVSRARLQWATLDSVEHLVPDSAGVYLDLRAEPHPRIPADATEPQLEDTAIAYVRNAIAAELRAFGGSRARIAVVALPGVIEAVPRSEREVMPVQYFAGRDSLGGWCAVAIGAYTVPAGDMLGHLFAGGSALGPCGYWARYGPPGSALAGLMPEAGHLLAAAGPSETTPMEHRRGLFGARHFRFEAPQAGLFAQGCLAGRTDTCVDALLRQDEWTLLFRQPARDHAAALFARSARRSGADAPAEHFFADVERALGVERFAALWRADGDAEAALDAALGANTASWIQQWAVSRYGREPLGPTTTPGTGALTLLAIALLVLASIGVARRRRIG